MTSINLAERSTFDFENGSFSVSGEDDSRNMEEERGIGGTNTTESLSLRAKELNLSLFCRSFT